MKTNTFARLLDSLKKITWIIIVWTFISVFQFYAVYNALIDFNCDIEGHDPNQFLTGSIFTGILAGTLGGILIVSLWKQWLRNKTYGRALLYIFLSYNVVYFVVAYCNELFMQSTHINLSNTHPEAWSNIWENIIAFDYLNYLFWLVLILLTLVGFQVNDKYGPGVFKDFLLGKYFRPRKEERIFMFLDMRSSTTIAEQLGDEKYFNLVRQLFSDVTSPIVNSKGEIYQYIGDEVIISWKMNNGLKEANCLNCFFEIQKKLKNRTPVYQKKYGLMPEFKAGLHYGHVMAGEVGVVKRDIAFSGDVLNTTARIQGMCNELGVDILLSEYLLQKLSVLPNQFQSKKMGDILLKGKQEKVTLYTI